MRFARLLSQVAALGALSAMTGFAQPSFERDVKPIFEANCFSCHGGTAMVGLDLRTATSILDFIFRILGMEYLGRTDFLHVAPEQTAIDTRSNGHVVEQDGEKVAPPAEGVRTPRRRQHDQHEDALNEHLAAVMGDAPVCDVCGHLTVRNGTCYRCLNCGNSMGCS